jgi:hypothetical protein
MNTNPQNPNQSGPFPGSAEETLRVIAKLPAPAGLEDRVRATLKSAPSNGRVLDWPASVRSQSSWMRSAAAAAIVFVVAGGGWGVYTHVQQNQGAKVLAMPPQVAHPGGFASAGAKRTPQTIPGPTVKAMPATPQAQAAAAKKPVTHVTPKMLPETTQKAGAAQR